MMDPVQEREYAIRRSESGAIDADEFYSRMASTYPEGSEQRREYELKAKWASERICGLHKTPFSEWKKNQKVN